MFSNLGLHVVKFPSGRYGYRGSIPVTLGSQIPATTSAVMGGRAFRNDAGEIVEWKFPVFNSSIDAIRFAESKGCSIVYAD